MKKKVEVHTTQFGEQVKKDSKGCNKVKCVIGTNGKPLRRLGSRTKEGGVTVILR